MAPIPAILRSASVAGPHLCRTQQKLSWAPRAAFDGGAIAPRQASIGRVPAPQQDVQRILVRFLLTAAGKSRLLLRRKTPPLVFTDAASGALRIAETSPLPFARHLSPNRRDDLWTGGIPRKARSFECAGRNRLHRRFQGCEISGLRADAEKLTRPFHSDDR